MTALHCPTCGHEIETVPMQALAEVRLSGQCRRLLDALVQRYPRDVHHESLWISLYAARADGGPDDPGNVIAVLMGRLRTALAPYGWTVSKAKCGTGSRGRYRLQTVEEK